MDWISELGWTPQNTRADINRKYRRRALKAHPDKGGSQAAFERLTAAYEEAKRHTSSSPSSSSPSSPL